MDQRGSVGNDYSSGSESSGSGGSEGTCTTCTPEPVICSGGESCHQEAEGDGSSQVIGRKKWKNQKSKYLKNIFHKSRMSQKTRTLIGVIIHKIKIIWKVFIFSFYYQFVSFKKFM